jgi:hypothetical protein
VLRGPGRGNPSRGKSVRLSKLRFARDTGETHPFPPPPYTHAHMHTYSHMHERSCMCVGVAHFVDVCSHIDCASNYLNEFEVGDTLSKVRSDDLGPLGACLLVLPNAPALCRGRGGP